MEDRVARSPGDGPSGALAALVVILVITAAWWALALWPVGEIGPDWVARTRAACFGSIPGGLPNAGGWILLVGEPLGMLAMLWAIGGRSLRRDWRWIAARRVPRLIVASLVTVTIVATATLAVRVGRVWAATRVVPLDIGSVARRMHRATPSVALVDQEGRRTSFTDLRGRTVLLTFAYGHCATVCPSIINDLRLARQTAGRADARLVVMTIDPWRDTPERLPTLARHWNLDRDDRVLSGSVEEVAQALLLLGITRRRDEVTGDVEHATTAMIVDQDGWIVWRVDGGARGVAALLR